VPDAATPVDVHRLGAVAPGARVNAGRIGGDDGEAQIEAPREPIARVTRVGVAGAAGAAEGAGRFERKGAAAVEEVDPLDARNGEALRSRDLVERLVEDRDRRWAVAGDGADAAERVGVARRVRRRMALREVDRECRRERVPWSGARWRDCDEQRECRDGDEDELCQAEVRLEQRSLLSLPVRRRAVVDVQPARSR